jgi:hypothetical protein
MFLSYFGDEMTFEVQECWTRYRVLEASKPTVGLLQGARHLQDK